MTKNIWPWSKGYRFRATVSDFLYSLKMGDLNSLFLQVLTTHLLALLIGAFLFFSHHQEVYLAFTFVCRNSPLRHEMSVDSPLSGPAVKARQTHPPISINPFWQAASSCHKLGSPCCVLGQTPLVPETLNAFGLGRVSEKASSYGAEALFRASQTPLKNTLAWLPNVSFLCLDDLMKTTLFGYKILQGRVVKEATHFLVLDTE